MKKFTIKFGLASILVCALFISSCSKDNNAVVPDGPTVRLNIGQAYAKADPIKTAAATSRAHVAAVQAAEIPFDNQYTLVATLIPIAETAPVLKASNRAASVSSASETIPLKSGTKYYVAIFDAADNYVETKTFIQGAGHTEDFIIAKGNYTFVVYASGTGQSLPVIQAGTNIKLDGLTFEGMTAGQDFMLDQVAFEVKDGVNTLSADLEHLFTQVALKLDASAAGQISVQGAAIEPSSETVDVTLANGDRKYSGNTVVVPFTFKSKNGTVVRSDSTFITTPAVTNGKISLSGLSIGGSAAKDIATKGNWNLSPGVKYELEITLKSSGATVGNVVWAPGNLVYNPDGAYTFAKANEVGSEWYFNWLTPIGVGNTPADYNDMPAYSVDRDPCQLAGKEWRTPTYAEYLALLKTQYAFTNWDELNQGYKVPGVHFGTKDLAAAYVEPSKYLFFIGPYNYWTTDIDGTSNAKVARFEGQTAPNMNTSERRDAEDNNGHLIPVAPQIRCVKAK